MRGRVRASEEPRALATRAELEAARRVFAAVFGAPVPSAVDLRGSLLAGGACFGASDAPGELDAALWAFAGHDDDGAFRHVHVLAVRAERRGRGLGERLLRAASAGQRRLTWTFDPLVAANARFYLERIGAVGDAWIADCYGPLEASAVPTDRLHATLHVTLHVAERSPLPGGDVVTVPLPRAEQPATERLQHLRARLAPLVGAGGRVVGFESGAYRVAMP